MKRLREYEERGLRNGLSTLGDFRKFILRGNVVDLAIGVVIGVAFTAVVNGMVKDLLSPLIGLIGIPNFSNFSLTAANGNKFLIGDFFNAVITFLITAFVIYFFVVRPVNALTERFTPHKVEEVSTRDCPFCLSSVPLKATRCAYCTAQLPPAAVDSITA